MERGEVQGIGNSSWSNWRAGFAHYLADKKVRILMQAGLTKNPELPDVPLVLDLAKDEAGRQMLELFLAPMAIGRPFASPPGLAPTRLSELRNAFDKTIVDHEFIADANKAKLEISSVSGAFIDTTLKRLYGTPPAVIATARKAVEATDK